LPNARGGQYRHAVYHPLALVRQRPRKGRQLLPGREKRTWRQDLTDALTILREAGEVDWEEIVDERREYTSFRTPPTIAEGVSRSVESVSLDRWGGKPAPLILCEDEAVRGVLYNGE
jgi:hypothetical protein